jgi:hypothetical protein
MEILRSPQGAFYIKTSEGIEAVKDPRTIQSLLQGSTPYKTESVYPNVSAPSVSNPSLVPQPGTSVTETIKPPIVPTETTGSTGSSSSNETPITKFNLAILDMLQKAQNGGGNEDLYKQQTGLQRAAIGRTSEITPEELRNLNPSQQEAIRTGKREAIEPEIDAISAKIKANDSRLTNFESILGTMREMGQDLAKLSPSPGVIDGYVKMIESGGSPTSVPEEVRDSVISKVDWSKWTAANKKSTNDELTTYQQTQTFNTIVGKYNSSPLVLAKDRTPVLKSAIDAIRKDPGNAALQLTLGYSYVQALDTYQSAVREGELSNLNSIDSKVGEIQKSISQITSGKIIRSNVALQIADAAQRIVDAIDSAASTKMKSFESQANVAGVGDQWNQYVAGFQSPSTGTSGESTSETIRVIRISDGKSGTIPANEFDSKIYRKK